MTWEPLWLSFKIACAATLLTGVVGVAIALLLDWKKLPGRDLLDALMSAPLVLPPTVLGYYLLVVVGNESVVGELWKSMFGGRTLVFNFEGAVLAASLGSLPFVIRSTRIGLDAIDPNVIAAARTLGANRVRVIFTIVLPLAAPAIVAGCMLGFARALGDYGATLMVIGARVDGVQPASFYIIDEMLNNRDHNVTAMALAVTVFGITMLYLANRLTRRLGVHRV